VAVHAPTPMVKVLAVTDPWLVTTTVEKLDAPGAALVSAPNLLAPQARFALVVIAEPLAVDRHVVVVPPVGVTCSCINKLPDCTESPVLVIAAVNPPMLAVVPSASAPAPTTPAVKASRLRLVNHRTVRPDIKGPFHGSAAASVLEAAAAGHRGDAQLTTTLDHASSRPRTTWLDTTHRGGQHPSWGGSGGRRRSELTRPTDRDRGAQALQGRATRGSHEPDDEHRALRPCPSCAGALLTARPALGG